jgi:hypothetical protein
MQHVRRKPGRFFLPAIRLLPTIPDDQRRKFNAPTASSRSANVLATHVGSRSANVLATHVGGRSANFTRRALTNFTRRTLTNSTRQVGSTQ